MKQYSPADEELLSRLSWFVQLRWLFLLALSGLLFFGINLFHLKISLTPLVTIALVVLIYNTGFFILHWLRGQTIAGASSRDLRIEANLQIGLDLCALVAMIHYSGGIENPFTFFFIFHMIMGSILLAGRDIWFHAIGTIAVLFLILGLSFIHLIGHYHIEGFASPQLWSNVPYILAGMIAFGTTIIMTVYMTNSVSRSVRKRETELFGANKELETKSQELEAANRELIRQQTLLIQSEKLASLGKLSAGIAHELNSPLTGILNFSHFIKDYCANNDQVQYDISVVIRETTRCKNIIKGLLDYARQSQPEKKMNDIIKLLERTINLVENHKDFKDIEIIEDFDENLPQIMVDHDQIQQVFMNLLVNAQEAMPTGGVLSIRVRYDREANCIDVKFQDSGHGIDDETMKKIFDPFFTTKEMGTGLGLSISLGIIQNHHGRLDVESTPGKGSIFAVRLPTNGEAEKATGDRPQATG